LRSFLVVIYGAPLAGKTSLAWQVARSLPGKAAVVSVDALLGGGIAVPAEDAASELEMVHTQMRLLVANYMRNGYHVVVEGPFYYSRGGAWFGFERDIGQLVALMRNMTERSLVVRLEASAELLEARARASGRGGELEDAVGAAGRYGPRYGPNALTLDASEPLQELAAKVRGELGLFGAS